MPGYSLHIALNRLDPNAYQPPPVLAGCINDANSMQRIASSLGYRTRQLLDGQATSVNVLEAIGTMARTCGAGDIAMITYSGHGGQVTDHNGDEPDGLDETWVCYDRQVCDDELYALYGQFQAGVRLVVVSDSCHSGSVARSVLNLAAREALVGNPLGKELWPSGVVVAKSRPKYLPNSTRIADDEAKRTIYRTVQALSGPARGADISAQLILLAGCQDNQFSQDGDGNGAFTEALLRVWADGGFAGDYRAFLGRITSLLPPDQTPNLFTVGTPAPGFLSQKPFTVTSPNGANGSVNGSANGAGTQGAGTTAWPTIRQGARGPAVQHLQERLNLHGYTCAIDGSFGPGTASQVRQFQSDEGLTADGVVGPSTWDHLEREPDGGWSESGTGTSDAGSWGDSGTGTSDGGAWGDSGSETADAGSSAVNRPTLRRGDHGEDVKYLQQRLSDLGYWVSVDGAFGAGTESSVRSLQNSESLPVDGVVGPATWAVLE